MELKKHLSSQAKISIVKRLHSLDLIEKQDNIIVMPKAFKYSSVLRWIIENKENLDSKSIQNTLRGLKDFISNKVDIVWKKDSIVFQKK